MLSAFARQELEVSSCESASTNEIGRVGCVADIGIFRVTSHSGSIFILAFVLAQSIYGAAAEASDEARPAVMRAIEKQGLEIMGEFQAPGGLRGFAGVTDNRPIAVYVTPDGVDWSAAIG